MWNRGGLTWTLQTWADNPWALANILGFPVRGYLKTILTIAIGLFRRHTLCHSEYIYIGVHLEGNEICIIICVHLYVNWHKYTWHKSPACDNETGCDICRDLRIFQEYVRLREAAEGHLLQQDDLWDWDEIEEWWSQFHDKDWTSGGSGSSNSSAGN